MDKFTSPFNPKVEEERVRTLWEESGCANPDTMIEKGYTAPDAPTFSIVLPPPNVTGTLHLGHASMLAIEDILVRTARMRGLRTLWIPGTDSAAIATESKVEGMLMKAEKKSRHDLGREEFLKRVEAFAKESHATITHQVKSVGASLDWSREAYTLDDTRVHAVNAAFMRMYEAGLIYKGARIVNWDPKHQTTVSDDELEYTEETSPFYTFKYGPFSIGTSRPETKFGDKYVVVNPTDERYAMYTHGQTFEVPWLNGTITATLIKDAAVDPEFGTGAMTITPWHDGTDFDIAKRHNLPYEQVIDFHGKLLPVAGEFAGMHIKKARPLIAEKMRELGLLVNVDEKYTHRVAVSSRGGGVIEPQIKEQWWVAVEKSFVIPHSTIPTIPSGSETTLKMLMREAVATGLVKINPERFEKIYFHWIDNLHDWCISRQIWYGHRIPAWYKDGEVQVSPASPGSGWEQESDTLDTWFSSGLWTISTMGWPKETLDRTTYHPTTVLETGYDIIFFWVARMILMTTFLTGEVPFKEVYLHGLVRDEKGRKMSKSLGNIIDPLDVSEKYGTDAVRLSLIMGGAPGNDIKLSEDRIRGYKHFANKVWNISRFVLQSAELVSEAQLHTDDQALVDEALSMAREVTTYIDARRLDLAADSVYHYLWHTFADVHLEASKEVLRGDDEAAKASRATALVECLMISLKTLHPFMPFVTESIWQEIPTLGTLNSKRRDMLMVESWPV